MSEHYYRVGVHGPPNPDEHPWVMERVGDEDWRLWHAAIEDNSELHPDTDWFPVDAPPSELAPVEDEGVEVDGTRWRQRWDGGVQWQAENGAWKDASPAGVFAEKARVAQALGLVPAVPASLIDWLRNVEHGAAPGSYGDGRRSLAGQMLTRIEAGEFGAVEPSPTVLDAAGLGETA